MKRPSIKLKVFGTDFNIPELDHCPPDVRSKLVAVFQANTRNRNRTTLTTAVQFFSLVVTLMLAAVTEAFVSWEHRHLLIYALLANWVVVVAAIDRRRVTRLQEEFRRFFRDYCPDGRPRFCVKCDYDLRGTPGALCPECGAAVPQWVEREGS